MPLRVDLSGLWASVRQMGARPVEFEIRPSGHQLDPIDLQLEEGLELSDLSALDVDNGLISYEGRQVLLYIPDHGTRALAALDKGAEGNKFHVADCTALKSMRSKGRFERYVATNNLSGHFEIHGEHPVLSRKVKGKAELKVCKFCLKHLRYKGYSGPSSKRIFDLFSLSEFFETYSSFFPHMPGGLARNDALERPGPGRASAYGTLKAERNFICENCGVDLSDHKENLQVHHRNGDPSDCSLDNLKVLCALCVVNEPKHQPTFVSHADRQKITRLRREQKVLRSRKWEVIYELADPGLHGVLSLCEKKKVKLPEVGLDIQARDSAIVATLELAWRRSRVGVAIDEADIAAASEQGWEVWSMNEVMEDEETFIWNVQAKG